MFSSIPRKLTKVVLLLGLFCLAGRAFAQPQEELQHKAATLFDRGVAEFSAAQYEAAARSFLGAGEMLPNKEALKNALAASKRASQPRLIAESAARLLALAGLDERTRREAQTELDKAAPQLARVDVACTPMPCALRVDGEPTSAGIRYVTPGTHEFVASNTEGWQLALPASCDAGALCQVKLELAPALSSPAPTTQEPAAGAPAERAATPERVAQTAPAQNRAPARRDVPALAAFVGAASATATLIALVSWSGAQALAARHKHEDDPAAYDPHEVRRLAHRTDYLLIGAVAAAGATAAIGIWWVDFGGRRHARLSLDAGRGITLTGRF